MDGSQDFRKVRWMPMVGRMAMVLVALAMVPMFLLLGCQSKLIYFPRAYPVGLSGRWVEETPGRMVNYATSQGKQRAFLQGNLENPQRLWIVCGGNGTVALEWSGWLKRHGAAADAWLLVDFPGYGDCEGAPNPKRIAENLRTVVPLACQEIGWDGVRKERLRVFGHSLGAAACLMGAVEFGVRGGVLLAPFTSTMDMTNEVVGLPLGFLVTHRFDNRARLTELAEKGPGRLVILHGSDDEVIPVAMGSELAAAHPEWITFRELDGGRHNTLQEDHTAEIVQAMREVSE
jgi:pimeloyl-ACP methyl ester carboxylesterase